MVWLASTIRSASDVDAALAHPALSSNGDHRIGAIRRVIGFSVRNPPADRMYVIDDTLELTANFDGWIFHSGTVSVTIDVGGEQKVSTTPGRISGEESKLRFNRYVVAEGDLDDDGVHLPANALAGRVAHGSSNQPVFTEHAEWRPNPPVLVDGIRPTIESEEVNGTTLTLTWSEPMNTAAVPDAAAFTLELASGDTAPTVDSVAVIVEQNATIGTGHRDAHDQSTNLVRIANRAVFSVSSPNGLRPNPWTKFENVSKPRTTATVPGASPSWCSPRRSTSTSKRTPPNKPDRYAATAGTYRGFTHD